jgi:type II secretory pathway component PulC
VKMLNQIKERYLVSADPLRTERRVELVALCLAVLLMLQLVYSVIRVTTLSLPEAKPVAAGTLRIVKVAQLSDVSAEQHAVMVARPLFWPSRRPLVPPPAPVVKDKPVATNAKAGDLKKVKLLGIFSGEESAGVIAIVSGKKQRIRVQEKALEWTLTSVAQDRAVFSYNGQKQELLLAQGRLPSGGADKAQKDEKKSNQAKRKQGKKAVDSTGIKRLGTSRK